jgi:hypothetical protein
MDSVCHMDREGFMRCLEGTKSMGQRICIATYLQLESFGHKKESSERNRKVVKGTTELGKRNHR